MPYGTGAYRYELVEDWAKPTCVESFVDVVGISVDTEDRIYAFNRSAYPVIVLDRDGNELNRWGEGVFKRPHGSCMGPDGNIYCTDDFAHVVHKFTPAGERLMTIGTADQPTDTGHRMGLDIFERVASIVRAAGPFNQPTGVGVARDGGIFVSDGYGNARVHRFAADGQWELSWGEPGGNPGQFRLPHNIFVGPDDRIWISDRENSRVQIFSRDGEFLDQWTDVIRPTHVHIDAAGTVYVSELCRRLSIFDGDGTLLARWGNEADPDNQLLHGPHVMALDSEGSLYVGEVATSFGKTDRGARTIQKFARV